jgi:uncharacterized protein YecE (DUF72 family)
MAGKVYIGIAGWSYPDWNRIVYANTSIDQLKFVISFVDCIEINNTFYRPPVERNSQSWLNRTSAKPDFLFRRVLRTSR